MPRSTLKCFGAALLYFVKDYFADLLFVCAEVEMIAAEWDDFASARSESAP